MAASGWAETPAARFTLVGGDLSGIQDFIYNVTSQAAARGLRGRSFFLQLLGDAIVRRLLRELDLCWANTVYEAGGNFLLLVPARDGVVEKLQAVLDDVNTGLIEAIGGDLALVMAWDEIEAQDLGSESFTAKRNGIGELLGRRKNERYLEQMRVGGYKELFDPEGAGASEDGYCHVCHRELRGSRTSGQDNVLRCEFCSSFEDLARQIAHDELWTVVEPWERPASAYDWQTLLEHVSGYRYRFEPAKPRTSMQGGYAYHWNNTDRTLVHEGYRFVANSTPRIDAQDIAFAEKAGIESPKCDEVKDFRLMALQAHGIKRVGVLRMDVDNLGTIFGEYLRASMPQLSALSAAMTLFFCGHLNRICQRIEEETRTLYTIYAGGDDLFIVGAWDRMPALAHAIREEFGRYTGEHPAFTISGGVALEGAHFPLYRAAEQSAEAEAQAKRYTRQVTSAASVDSALRKDPDAEKDVHDAAGGADKKKDAFSFLGTPVGWEDWPVVLEMRDKLTGLITGGVSRSLLQLCARLHQLWEASPEATTAAGTQRYGRWQWMSAYALTRMAQGLGPGESAALLEIRDDWLAASPSDGTRGSGSDRVRWQGLAARWVEYATRR